MTPLHYELSGGEAKLTVAISSAENLPFASLPDVDTDVEEGSDSTVILLDGVPFGSWLRVGVSAEDATGTITGINVNRQQSLKAL